MKMTIYIINVWHTPAVFVCKLEISKLVYSKYEIYLKKKNLNA